MERKRLICGESRWDSPQIKHCLSIKNIHFSKRTLVIIQDSSYIWQSSLTPVVQELRLNMSTHHAGIPPAPWYIWTNHWHRTVVSIYLLSKPSLVSIPIISENRCSY